MDRLSVYDAFGELFEVPFHVARRLIVDLGWTTTPPGVNPSPFPDVEYPPPGPITKPEPKAVAEPAPLPDPAPETVEETSEPSPATENGEPAA